MVYWFVKCGHILKKAHHKYFVLLVLCQQWEYCTQKHAYGSSTHICASERTLEIVSSLHFVCLQISC